MLIPKPRGPLSEAVFAAWRLPANDLSARLDVRPESDDDAAIPLWASYQLHYGGFEEVDEDLEWHPDVLRLRASLELDLERRLRARCGGHQQGGDFAADFFSYVDSHDGRSIAAYVQSDADAEQVRDLLRVRSVYHLGEADPISWVVPRLSARTKAALMEVLYDEYGSGDPNRLHSHLFAVGMGASGLRTEYGAYVDEAPLEILEQNNAMSLFGLHRRHRGAALGHFAAFEATSSMPSRRMVQGLERLGFPDEMVRYYTEHVEADSVHEQLAVRVLCGALLEEEPELAADVFFGAFTCMDLEDRVAGHLLHVWGALE